MRLKSIVTTILAAISLLIIILDSKRALIGAQEGVSICMHTVIPSLLPFLFFSSMLTEGMQSTGSGLLRPLGWLWKIPKSTEHILLVGLLGGYPTGAHSVSFAYEHGHLSKDSAQRMLAFCNNCGPAFIFGIIGGFFDNTWQVAALWLIHLVSSAIISWMMPCYESAVPVRDPGKIRPDKLLRKSIAVLAQICGWVILFRMLITFLDGWFGFILPPSIHPALYGILELTNGCLSLFLLSDVGHRFILCSAIIALGGFCVTMQTSSVVSKDLNMKLYILGKLMQTASSICFSSLVAFLLFKCKINYLLPLLSGGFFMVFAIILRKSKNNSRFLPAVVV